MNKSVFRPDSYQKENAFFFFILDHPGLITVFLSGGDMRYEKKKSRYYLDKPLQRIWVFFILPIKVFCGVDDGQQNARITLTSSSPTEKPDTVFFFTTNESDVTVCRTENDRENCTTTGRQVLNGRGKYTGSSCRVYTHSRIIILF